MDKTSPAKSFLHQVIKGLKEFWHWLSSGLHELKVAFLTGFTHWIDPKLNKYRTRAEKQRTATTINHTPAKNAQITETNLDTKEHTNLSTTHVPKPSDYAPESTADFLALLKRTPRSVLSSRERHVIATIMNFPTAKVSELMLPKSAITYVHADEVLGPLTLDRLYRSGFQHFPVLNKQHQIIGLVHTTSFNNLEIKETRRVEDILDPKICYVREDYSLNQALAAFLRTNSYFFLVIDHYERIVGMITYQMLVDYLLGETPSDNFDRDSDRLAVAKRK